MAITPQQGYIVDPNNPNGVIHDPNYTPYPAQPSSLNSTNTQSSPAITLPSTPAPQNYGSMAMAASIGAKTPPATYYDATGNQIDVNGNVTVPATTPTNTSSTGNSSSLDWLKSQLPTLFPKAQTNLQDTYNTISSNQGLTEKQTRVNDLTAKLAGMDAQALAGQEKALQSGETTGYASREAQNLSRTNAIERLAVSAELNGAQGRLQSAESNINTIFGIYQKDSENTYNHQLALFNSISNIVDKAEAKQIEAKKTELATNHSDLADARNFAQQLSATATTNGQGSIASQLASLTPPDINSKTFASDLATYNQKVGALQGRIVPRVTSNSKPTQSGNLTYTPQDQSEDSLALEKSRGTDGYVDPTIYQNLYKAWTNNGGLLKDFLLKYPPKNYVNPTNDWLPPFLLPPKPAGIVNPF